MITKTRKSYGATKTKRCTKKYYLLIVDKKIIGLCTNIDNARGCAKYYAKKYSATEIAPDIYEFMIGESRHLIYFEEIHKVKSTADCDDDDEE